MGESGGEELEHESERRIARPPSARPSGAWPMPEDNRGHVGKGVEKERPASPCERGFLIRRRRRERVLAPSEAAGAARAEYGRVFRRWMRGDSRQPKGVGRNGRQRADGVDPVRMRADGGKKPSICRDVASLVATDVERERVERFARRHAGSALADERPRAGVQPRSLLESLAHGSASIATKIRQRSRGRIFPLLCP